MACLGRGTGFGTTSWPREGFNFIRTILDGLKTLIKPLNKFNTKKNKKNKKPVPNDRKLYLWTNAKRIRSFG